MSSKIRLSGAQVTQIREHLSRYNENTKWEWHRGGTLVPLQTATEELVEEILTTVMPEISISLPLAEERPHELAELIGGSLQGDRPILPRADAPAGESVVDGPEDHGAEAGAERQRNDRAVDG